METSAIVYGNKTAQEVLNQTEFDQTFAINVLSEAADYLRSTPVQVPTPLERSKMRVERLMAQNESIISRNKARISSIDTDLKALWDVYEQVNTDKKKAIKVKEALRRAGKPTDEANQKIQASFSRVGEILSKVNRLKTLKDACHKVVFECVALNSAYRKALKNESLLLEL